MTMSLDQVDSLSCSHALYKEKAIKMPQKYIHVNFPLFHWLLKCHLNSQWVLNQYWWIDWVSSLTEQQSCYGKSTNYIGSFDTIWLFRKLIMTNYNILYMTPHIKLNIILTECRGNTTYFNQKNKIGLGTEVKIGKYLLSQISESSLFKHAKT